MIPFRSIVASQMVRVHKIPSELAEYHVSRMDRKELLRRFKKYAGMELGMNLIECPICLEMVERLVRDHNHETGYIRGGICNPCNGKLGLLERHPESYYLRKKPGGRLWRRWVYDNVERIYAHLQKNTGEQMGRQLESRWVKEAMKLFDKPGLGLPLALALPESAESRTNLGETEGHGSLMLSAIAVRSPSGGGGGGVDSPLNLAGSGNTVFGERLLLLISLLDTSA